MFYFFCLFANQVSAKEISHGSIEIAGNFDLSSVSDRSDNDLGAQTELDNKKLEDTLTYYFFNNMGAGLNWSHSIFENSYDDGTHF